MTIDTKGEVLEFSPTDPLVYDRLLPYSEAQIADAHKQLRVALLPERIAMALCDSLAERLELRKEVDEQREAVLRAETFLGNAIHEQHDINRRVSSEKIVTNGLKSVEAARLRKAA